MNYFGRLLTHPIQAVQEWYMTRKTRLEDHSASQKYQGILQGNGLTYRGILHLIGVNVDEYRRICFPGQHQKLLSPLYLVSIRIKEFL
jgi:hypothetical protein